MTDSLEAAGQRRSIHETLSRIAQQGGIPARRVDVPWMVDAICALQESELSVEQALILGTYLVAVSRGAAAEQAASN